jgi:hypothetical protein
MSRWKASGIHFEAAGGDRLIFILAAVDVTLGPLITLIIFKAGKKGLKFDLAVARYRAGRSLVVSGL